jgi:hypothetical protein
MLLKIGSAIALENEEKRKAFILMIVKGLII